MLPKFGMFLSINLDFWVVLLDAPYALPFSGCAIGTVVLSLLAADSRQRHHLSGRETGGGWGFQCRWFSGLNAFEAFMGQMNIVPVLGESFNQVGFGRFGVGQRNPLPVKSLLSFSFGSEFVHPAEDGTPKNGRVGWQRHQSDLTVARHEGFCWGLPLPYCTSVLLQRFQRGWTATSLDSRAVKRVDRPCLACEDLVNKNLYTQHTQM